MAKRSILGKTYFDEKFAAVGEGGSGGNPTGGTVEVATTNYLATLFQQWISMTIGSASAVRMNLLSCLIEPFRLYASTNFYLWANTYTNGINDYLASLFAATGTYLDGYCSPAHLRLSCHFEGTGSIPSSIVSADSPIYNSDLGSVAKWNSTVNNIINSGIISNEFTGGTATSNNGNAANAFDLNDTTACAGLQNTSINYVQYDFGEGVTKVLTDFYVYIVFGVTCTFYIQGSNDNSNWTNLYTGTGKTFQLAISTSNTTAYRYYRIMYNTAATYSTFNVYSFAGFATYLGVSYDTTNFKFGTSSAKFGNTSYLSGVASAVAQLHLYNYDWHYRSFIRFSSAPGTHALFSILGKELEIQAISTGLRVKYSTDGLTFVTVDSSEIIWNTDTWYFISVRRTGNTLYFYVDGTAYGTADLTGVTFFATNTNSFYIGADSAGTNLFNGNMDELEFFVGESIEDTVPTAARSTAFVPDIAWQSGAQYINSEAESLEMLFFLDEAKFSSIAVPIMNTDIIISISIDNGSNFYPLTLTKVGMLTINTAIYRGNLSLTGKTNTNQLIYKIVGSNNKPVKYDGCVISWQ